jgi:hypothetical protein
MANMETRYDNSSTYFDLVVATQSMAVEQQAALEGAATLSFETQDVTDGNVLTYIEDNFAEFLVNLRFLSKEDQELLLSYYILSKTQAALAILHRSTQSLCSLRIRRALQKMAAFILLGPPTAVSMRLIFLATNLEHALAEPLSRIVEMYAQTRSFQRVAEVLSLHRPDIRRVMSEASKVLLESEDPRHTALGAYVWDLIEKASAYGTGLNQRKLAKGGNIFVTDPAILGQFRMRVEDPGFKQVFGGHNELGLGAYTYG